MSRRPTIAVLDYGMGNLRSVANAIEHVGGRPLLLSGPDAADAGDAVVVPGVGAFGACMRGLVERGLDATVGTYLRGTRPVLGVCLGMQVLFASSDEDPGPGLEYFSGRVRKLPPTVKVPHMGWNEVRWTGNHDLIEGIPSGTRFYFVHSYAPDLDPRSTVGETEYGTVFAAAVAKGPVFATQFHPERSGDAGLEIYRNLVRAAA
ncbi:MAG: imidazole glycerol phosphate synthase subunit HisH [Actinomycetota bacterium]